MTFADEIEHLKKLRDEGALSEEEFQQAKEAKLRKERPVGDQLVEDFESFAGDENNYAMFLHLSQFCTYLAPGAGIIVPIILWVVKKDQSPTIDAHGRIVVNWLISAIIYAVLGFLLCLTVVGIVVGIPLFILLTVLGIVYPIVGGLKAQQGEVWNYPGTFRFF